MDNLYEKFKKKNLKLTPQRYAIYKYLISTKSHPSVEIIYEHLKSEYPTMSLATVYKTIKTLIELNLIQQLNVGEDNFRFDANINTHPHIVCTICSRVDDIENANFNFLNEEIKNFTDYSVTGHQLYFYGVCPECKKGR